MHKEHKAGEEVEVDWAGDTMFYTKQICIMEDIILKNFLERITILSEDEINSIYNPPCLSEEEQCLYFTMDAEEYAIAHSHRSVGMKILFILQLGYFKAKKLFFNFTKDENKKVIQFLGILDDNIKYYASLVEYYSVFSLQRFSRTVSYIYLICFIYHRYQRINDNLINTFIYHERKYEAAAKLTAKTHIYKLSIENNQRLGSADKILANQE